jgi:hypothetical protein
MSLRTELAERLLKMERACATDKEMIEARLRIEAEHGTAMLVSVLDLCVAELREDAERAQRAVAANLELARVFDGLPRDITLREAATIKAQSGPRPPDL